MTRLRHLLSVITLGLLFATPLAHAAAPDSFAPIIEPLMPAVVNISTTQKATQPGQGVDSEALPEMQNEQLRQFFRQFGMPYGALPNGGGNPQSGHPVTSLGSGFVIDPAGYVVTNNHVIGNAEAITVIFQDNARLPATVVGRDEKTDLALLKVTPPKPLVSVKFGDSEALHVGDWVIAIGNPFGLGGSVSAGIVSARGRNINAGPFDDFIQTDAAINRGNSGGPLFNTRGEVVGINAAIFSPSGGNIGIGFAVPSSMAKTLLAQLREFGQVQRGWLGVKVEVVSDELANSLGMAKPRGALLRDITKPGPAASAGLLPGDVVLKFDGREIDEMRKLPRYVAEAKSGKKVEVVIWRKGKEQTLSVTIGEVPKDPKAATNESTPDLKMDGKKATDNLVLGMRVVPLTKEIRVRFNIKPEAKGLFVDGIDRQGEAAKRGVVPGDVIMEANQMELTSAEDLRKAIDTAKKAGHDYALIRVLRRGEPIFATVSVK